MIQQSMLIVRSPAWATLIVDFDLNHGFDAVNDSGNSDFLFLFDWRLLHMSLRSFGNKTVSLPAFAATSVNFGRRSQARSLRYTSPAPAFAAANAASKT